jgi:hypothetical protein
MNKKTKFLALAMFSVMAVLGITSQVWADQQLRLRARQNKIINGFEAELRGDYREQSGPFSLSVSLEKINLPVGTAVAFCVSHDGVSTRIGTGHVQMEAGVPEASVELDASNGASVPKVDKGDILQARQHAVAPFITHPACGAPLLIAAPFQQ